MELIKVIIAYEAHSSNVCSVTNKRKIKKTCFFVFVPITNSKIIFAVSRVKCEVREGGKKKKKQKKTSVLQSFSTSLKHWNPAVHDFFFSVSKLNIKLLIDSTNGSH